MLLVLQESDESVHHEAYNTLSKILEVWICVKIFLFHFLPFSVVIYLSIRKSKKYLISFFIYLWYFSVYVGFIFSIL